MLELSPLLEWDGCSEGETGSEKGGGGWAMMSSQVSAGRTCGCRSGVACGPEGRKRQMEIKRRGIWFDETVRAFAHTCASG